MDMEYYEYRVDELSRELTDLDFCSDLVYIKAHGSPNFHSDAEQ